MADEAKAGDNQKSIMGGAMDGLGKSVHFVGSGIGNTVGFLQNSVTSAVNRIGDATHSTLDFLAPADLAARKKKELKFVKEADTTKLPDGELWYLISREWVNAWLRFVTSSRAPPPGHISNETLLDACGNPLPNLRPVTNYRAVTVDVWNFYYKIYGGGPVLCR